VSISTTADTGALSQQDGPLILQSTFPHPDALAFVNRRILEVAASSF